MHTTGFDKVLKKTEISKKKLKKKTHSQMCLNKTPYDIDSMETD